MTVADCERVQTEWFRLRAEQLGGRVWTDDGMLWTDGPDGLNVMFPRVLSAPALDRGVEFARAAGRDIVGAWLSTDVDASALARAGFERGWSPSWMTAPLAAVPAVADDRVVLEQDTSDYAEEDPSYRELLALTRLETPRAWYAAAHDEGGRFAGRAWSFLDGELAGVFDMDVWPPFRRRGLGRALLATVCAAAARAGARQAVLNATPEGRLLYRSCGFAPIGAGTTWWHRPSAARASGLT